jgi:hypothetical protein
MFLGLVCLAVLLFFGIFDYVGCGASDSAFAQLMVELS